MGSSTKKTKQTYAPPSWIEDASHRAIDLGTQISNREYVPYTGDRIAGLSRNEKMGMKLARTSAGGWQPYLDQSNAALKSAGQDFTEADINSYMNPYIKGALDPAARELREQGALRINDLQATEAQRESFGGSRGALLESEANRGLEEGISDLYGRGYASAFESASDRWARDREMEFRQAGGYMAQAQLFRDASSADINQLMQTGAVDRSIKQAMKDFDYQQFTEEQNWDVKNLSALIAAIQGVHGSYGTTQTTTEKTSDNPVSQVMGIAAMVGGAMMGGPMGAAAGASAFGGSAGGSPVPMPYMPPPTVTTGGTNPGEWMPQAAPINPWGG